LGGAPVGVVALHVGEKGPLEDPVVRSPHAWYMVHILFAVIDFVDFCQIRLFALTGTALVGSAARNKHRPKEQ